MEANNERQNKEFDITLLNKSESIKYSENGRFLACLIHNENPKSSVLRDEPSIIIYDVENRLEYSRVKLKMDPRDYICFDVDGNNFLMVLFIETIFLWDLDTGKEYGNFSAAELIYNFTISEDHTLLGFTALDRESFCQNKATFTRVFKIKSGIKVYESKHGYSKRPAKNMCFSPDNKYLIIAIDELGEQLVLKIVNIMGDNGNIQEGTYQLAINGVHNMKFHPNGKKLYIVEKSSGNIVVFDIVNRRLEKYLSPNNTKDGAYDIEFNRDGSLLLTKSEHIFLTKSNKYDFKVFDAKTGKIIFDINEEINDIESGLEVISASLNPADNYVAVLLNNNTIRNINIYPEVKDELFEIDESNNKSFIEFPNKGCKEYKKPAGCLVSILQLIVALFLMGSPMAIFGDEFLGIGVVLGIVWIAYIVYKDRKAKRF